MKPRKMKDSGIPWIGQIPEGWSVRRLKRTSDLVVDKCPPINEDEEDGLMYVGLEHVESRSGRLIYGYKPICDFSGDTIRFEKGNVLFGKLRPYLAKCWLADTAGKCSSEFFVLRPIDEYVGVFLHWTMLSSRFVDLIDGSTFGVKMPRAEWSFVGNIHMPFPAVPEQERIAAYLDDKCGEIDRVIAAKERQNELLKAQRTAIISETVTKGLNPKAKLKDSGNVWIGSIPASWRVTRLKRILRKEADAIRVGPFGSQLKGADFSSEGYKVYDQRAVLDNDFFGGDKFVGEEKFHELGAFTVNPGDILLTTRGTIGKIAIVPTEAGEGIIHPCLIRFRISGEEASPEFIKYLFNGTTLLAEQFSYYSNATTIEVIYSDVLKNVSLPCPPLPEQREITAYLDARCGEVDRVVAANEGMVAKLKEYRSSVIWEAVTGKVAV